MIELLQHLGAHDALLAGILIGIWWAGRNRRDTGQRIGHLEDAISEVRGLLKAIGGNGDKR